MERSSNISKASNEKEGGFVSRSAEGSASVNIDAATGPSKQSCSGDLPPIGVSITGGAHPKVVRALKLMRDIHWDTSGAVVGSVTEYTPILIRNIDDIKRDARSNLLRSSKIGRHYHIQKINPTSNVLRPNSANAKFVAAVYREEEDRIRQQRRRLRKSKSQSMDRSPLHSFALKPSPRAPFPVLDKTSSMELELTDIVEFNSDVFEDTVIDDPGSPEHPLSGKHSSPIRSERPFSGKDADCSHNGTRAGSANNNGPNHRHNLANFPPSTGGGLKKIKSFSEGTTTKMAPVITKIRSFEIKPKATKEEKEKAALAKIEEKRQRVLQKQLSLEQREQTVLWMKIVAHFSRTGLFMATLLKARNFDASIKMFTLSQGIILKILKWWRPVRINVWKRKNPHLVNVLMNFFLRAIFRIHLYRVRTAASVVGKFLRDVSNAGERYKKMKHFRLNIIRLQDYARSFCEVQRNRVLLMKMALDNMVLDQLNKLKKEKAAHELNAVNKLKYRREFGPTVIKIQKITLYTNQLLNTSAASMGHVHRRRRPQSSTGENSQHPQVEGLVGADSTPSLVTTSSSNSSMWYPGSSFSGFGVNAGGKPPHPEYTRKLILADIKSVLAHQRRRHTLAAAEHEANFKANKGISDVGLSRVKSFLKDKDDIGPMVEDASQFKVKRQYFLLLTMGGLSELEEIAARVVHEYLNTEAVKIKIAI